MDLKTAYRYRRAHQWRAWENRRVVSSGPCAVMAIDLARADVAKLATAQAALTATGAAWADNPTPENKAAHDKAISAVAQARRPSYGPPSPACLTWQTPDASDRRGRRLAYVEKPDAFGLRYVGRTVPEGGRGDLWDTRESCGWHTDPFGDVFRDGTGLCYGVVYQLPGRRGVARFVAGYEFGGQDGGPCLDLGNIFESESMRGAETSAQDHDDARDAARVADSMAQHAAESEREYQTAWAAGSKWSDLGETIRAERREALKLLAERRTAKARGDSGRYPSICTAARNCVTAALETIREAREERAALAAGDADSLCFYPDARLKAAFCEAAGIDAYPA